MGLRDNLRGRRVYVDTNIIIYMLEGYVAHATALDDIKDSIATGECVFITGDVTLCEALVVPFRENRTDLIALYRRFLEDSGVFQLVATTRDIYVRASFYRAEFGLKTPDAIHVASAVDAGCDAFLTNDRPLRVPTGMKIITLG
jgi:predicted nucleic acid-binding protein